MMTVHGADRPVLLCWHEGQVFALDNRCPHMGFPLSKGSLDYGLLTCHSIRFQSTASLRVTSPSVKPATRFLYFDRIESFM